MAFARLSFLCFLITLTACSVTQHGAPAQFEPTNQVTREQALANAEAYRSHRWTPTANNIFHGMDPEGIRVDTPDASHQPTDGSRPGWWIPDKVNVGVPYQWGGFDTPSSFDDKVGAGYYAGDLYSEEKRRLLDNAVSKHATGVDCSGFISRCWRLERSFSTRELPALCTPLDSWSDLKKGDIANKDNAHVLLFDHWINRDRTHFIAYETGSPPTWKVVRHAIEIAYIESLGYRPYRYRNIID